MRRRSNAAFIRKLTAEDQEQILLNKYLAVFRYGDPKQPILWKHNGNEAKRDAAARKYWKLMGGQAGLPDTEILDPYGPFNGLAIELKRTGFSLFRQDGRLRQDKHLQKQAAMLKEYRLRGWAAVFAVGIDQARKVVDSYFSGQELIYDLHEKLKLNLCDCGEPVNARYPPCCSWDCWHKKYHS